LSEVKATCERIIMIAQGRIVADAKIADLEAQHGAPLEQVFARLAMS
jgi:ABC-type Na+ transport system ATPase subunit NatA